MKPYKNLQIETSLDKGWKMKRVWFLNFWSNKSDTSLKQRKFSKRMSVKGFNTFKRGTSMSQCQGKRYLADSFTTAKGVTHPRDTFKKKPKHQKW